MKQHKQLPDRPEKDHVLNRNQIYGVRDTRRCDALTTVIRSDERLTLGTSAIVSFKASITLINTQLIQQFVSSQADAGITLFQLYPVVWICTNVFFIFSATLASAKLLHNCAGRSSFILRGSQNNVTYHKDIIS